MPLVEAGRVPEDALRYFSGGGYTFLSATRLKSKMKSTGLEKGVEAAVKRLSVFWGTFRFGQDDSKPTKRNRCIFVNVHLFGILEHPLD